MKNSLHPLGHTRQQLSSLRNMSTHDLQNIIRTHSLQFMGRITFSAVHAFFLYLIHTHKIDAQEYFGPFWVVAVASLWLAGRSEQHRKEVRAILDSRDNDTHE